jgi:hypothetical protein
MTINSFLKRFGGLHDSNIESIFWNPSEGRFEIRFQDIFANFEGLPEYPGRASGELIFDEVKSITFMVDFSDRSLRVFDITAEDSDGSGKVCTMVFSPAGKIIIRSASIRFPQDAELSLP